ncbi:hypothetical protein HRbin17_00606 [bacterium HR17]|uniref:Uncharacterized protein n=1 Tax=Candidatus Fervidibacter japonicus TaxID=2035412 RepID=A0A2H5XA99_9BACT|nr:hypothetical protein HRbin17_00606 [bacterium HR17]
MSEEQKGQFINAVKAGEADQVRTLLQSSSFLRDHIDAPWFDFEAPAIVYAASRRNRAVIEALLEHGADINAKSQWWAGGCSALHTVSSPLFSYDPELAAYLIQHGATIDAHAAAGLGMLDKLVELITADPHAVHACGPDGMTPLHFAATPQVAELLLAYGADINARDNDHNGTPAQWAVTHRLDVCRYLIERGAEADIFLFCAVGDRERVQLALQADPHLVYAQTSGDAPGGHVYTYTIGVPSTPLHVAAEFNRCEVARLLLKAGSDVAARGPHGGTPLHLAAWHGHIEMVDLLLDYDPPLDSPCEDFGSPPLGWAVHGSAHCRDPHANHTAVVERLIAAGASVHIPGNKWGEPLTAMGTETIAALLRRHGATP